MPDLLADIKNGHNEVYAKRLEAYAEAIQTITLQKSSKVIEELIVEYV